MTVPTTSTESIPASLQSPSRSIEITPESRLKSLRAVLEELNVQDGVLKRQIESLIRARELSADLRQVIDSLPAAGGEQAIAAALDRLEQFSGLQTAVRPYLAMRPTPGAASNAGMMEKILRGAAAGLALGGVLALGIMWAGRRK
jgi:hypothetical protein